MLPWGGNSIKDAMPPRRYDPSEVQVRVGKTTIDDDSGQFVSDGEVTFTIEGQGSMTMPFCRARDRDDAVAQAAQALQTSASNFLKVARRHLEA